jgi:nucleotide-binding universal stress UspA family protein
MDPHDWHIRKMEIEASLRKMAEGLSRKGLSVNTAVLEGSDAEQLIQYAQAHEVDLMILTKQSETVGDLVHTVMKRTATPVVILPIGGYLLKDANARDCYQKILVPLDGSQRAEITLPIAATLAQDCNAQLLLVHVVHKPDMPRHAPPNAEEIELVERIVEINRAKAARYLENFTSRLPADAQTRLLVSDNIAATLHHLVEQESVDLIILSAHGYSGEPQRLMAASPAT